MATKDRTLKPYDMDLMTLRRVRITVAWSLRLAKLAEATEGVHAALRLDEVLRTVDGWIADAERLRAIRRARARKARAA